ncbi:hypothetical protein [Mycetocola sp. JXN-3]|uniref:hypothetical protein n=1 Tax=Mycetocola sp. JXN-3 TaxID=2116510 RepID=UPI00165D295D|nr:hypothetical protein [Mycetocola sp. JXN-3]
MTTIAEYLFSDHRLAKLGRPEADALRERDALSDAAILDFKYDATLLTLWVLFDCRGTLNMRDGNVAIIVANNVTSLQWSAPPVKRRIWRSVSRSNPELTSQHFNMTINFELSVADNGESLSFSCTTAEFHVGDIPGGDEAPPDFSDDSDEEIRAGLASWDSPFTPIHSSTI